MIEAGTVVANISNHSDEYMGFMATDLAPQSRLAPTVISALEGRAPALPRHCGSNALQPNNKVAHVVAGL